jgi:hypothetical protein
MGDDNDSSYDSQKLPSKLPILAPNGVVEIYNRVVDDLIRKLEVDLQKKELDPMSVVIRSTPPGPVRVPGYLQKRPFRRPGAALYRSSSPVQSQSGGLPSLLSASKKTSAKRGRAARAGVLPAETSRFGDARPTADGESASIRGAGKISKGPIEVIDDDEKEILETTAASTTTTTTSTTTEASKVEDLPPIAISSEERGSSEEDVFMKPRSDEFFPEPEEEEEPAAKPKKEKKKEESEEVEEEEQDDKGSKDKDVDSLIQHYQSKNSKTKDKYSGKKKNQKPVVVDPSEDAEIAGSSMEDKPVDRKPSEKERKASIKTSNKPKKESQPQQSEEDDDDEDDDEPEQRDDHEREEFDGPGPEPGTGGGKRPQGGYYPPQGPPVVPAKPNAELSGLSRIRRASDVSVSVDARSAVITARLLVGPINVVIHDSQEPMEKNVKATIPELEAEILLMERHGVVFLQRFTLDRAYGQDVEISIPKSKEKKKGNQNKNESDPSHPMNVETRRQTKMAAHVSMEVVKLLRSGNLRVNLMRTAQGAMSKLKLPIKKAKNKKKGKKEKKRND